MDDSQNVTWPMVVGIAAIAFFGYRMFFSEPSSQPARPDFARCLSGWDGSNRAFVDGVKARLREPRSFEHVRTTVGPDIGLGSRQITMTYRARNGFGGMNIEVAQAFLQTGNCQVTNIRT